MAVPAQREPGLRTSLGIWPGRAPPPRLRTGSLPPWRLGELGTRQPSIFSSQRFNLWSSDCRILNPRETSSHEQQWERGRNPSVPHTCGTLGFRLRLFPEATTAESPPATRQESCMTGRQFLSNFPCSGRLLRDAPSPTTTESRDQSTSAGKRIHKCL